MKKLLIGALGALALISMPVYAEGTATLDLVGKQEITVGETFDIQLVVNNVKDTYQDKGIASVGGDLAFNKEYLEVIEVEKASEPYQFFMNERIYRIAGLDFTLNNGIKEKTVIYTIKFKTLKEGNTNITLNNIKLTDTKDYVETIVNGLNVNINAKKTETIRPKSVNVTTTKKVMKTTTTNKSTTTIVKPTTITTKKTTTTTAKTTTTTMKIATTNKTTEKVEKAENQQKKPSLLTKIINFFKNLLKK